METSNLKNMVVLKNMPSNMIEEAIIVLKKNVNMKEIEIQNNAESINNKNLQKQKGKDYIVKEAEMIINHYMTKIETNKKKEILNRKINHKYEKMKRYLCITSLISIIEMLFLFIK